MPKATTKSSKKKKFNSRFPPARIKKIMQTDEEVGKVAAAVPVIISRALEMFIESFVTETAKLTQAKNAKTLSTSHIKQTIKNTKEFDFLRDLVKDVPDHQSEENNGDLPQDGESSFKRGKGRPKKLDGVNSGRKRKSGGNRTSSDEDDEEDDEDGVSEDSENETGGESPTSALSCPMDGWSRTAANVLPDAPAASSHQVPNSLHPSVSDSAMSHNNNNYFPHHTGPSQQSLSVQSHCLPPALHQSLPLRPDMNHQMVSAGPQHNQPMYPMPSSVNMPSSFAPYFPSKQKLYSHTPLTNESFPVTVSQNSYQQQPIDLTSSVRQKYLHEDDDYDS